MNELRSFARTWDAIGILLLVAGVAALPRQFQAPIDVYDEGLLLTHADHLAHGAVPYRDFYTNYPPGVYLLTALLWKVTGTSVLALRALGLVVHAWIAWFSGRLASRAGGSPRSISWLAAGATFLWLRHGPIWPAAWLAGLLFALVACELASRARGSAPRWFAAGLAYGAAGCMRHDLFVYACVALAVVLGVARIAGVRVEYPPRRAITWLCAGALLPLALVFGWILWKAGFRQPYHDLYRDMVEAAMPGRHLPLPALFRLDRLPLGVWIGFLAPILWAVELARGRRSFAWVALGVLALAGLPQMLNRTDAHHVVYALAPGLAILAVLAEHALATVRSPLVRAAASAGLLLLLAGATFGLRLKNGRDWAPFAAERAEGTRARTPELAAARERVLAFVAEHSRPDERIFVGCEQHARVFLSEMDLYFLGDRRGAVRRMQFDPNLSNRADEQERMIAEIEKSRTNVAVLAPYLDPHEPNDSAKSGSTLLDRFLAERFTVVERAGPYQLLLRRP